MKKMTAVLLIVATMCSFVGCDDKTTQSSTDNDTYMSAQATMIVNDRTTDDSNNEGDPLPTVVTTDTSTLATTDAATSQTGETTAPTTASQTAAKTTKATTAKQTTKATAAPTTKATTKQTTKATAAPTTKATTAPTTKATTAASNNTHYNPNNNYYDLNAVSIRPYRVWWEGSVLVAECFVCNGYSTPAYNINVNSLYISNESGTIAAAAFGGLQGLTVPAYGSVVWTFRFNSDCVYLPGADLNRLQTNSQVRFNY